MSLIRKQMPACMMDISKIALQACIMNSPLGLHSLQSRIAEIEKIRENVSSKRNSHKFYKFFAQTFLLGILMEAGVSPQKKSAEDEME
jgi:hypothetical protein